MPAPLKSAIIGGETWEEKTAAGGKVGSRTGTGSPDQYIGSFFLAGTYLAITCMTSAMTRNQVVAFILSVVLCLFLILAGFNPVTDLLARWASPAVVDTVAAFSVVTHFDGFQRGVIDLRDLVFFLSVIGFALFATGVIIRGHRAG